MAEPVTEHPEIRVEVPMQQPAEDSRQGDGARFPRSAIFKLDGVHAGPVQILAVVVNLAADDRALDQVVHPVEAADECALAAARGADQRRDALLVDVESDVADGRLAAVRDRDVLQLEDGLGRRVRLRDVARHRWGDVHARMSLRLGGLLGHGDFHLGVTYHFCS